MKDILGRRQFQLSDEDDVSVRDILLHVTSRSLNDMAKCLYEVTSIGPRLSNGTAFIRPLNSNDPHRDSIGVPRRSSYWFIKIGSGENKLTKFYLRRIFIAINAGLSKELSEVLVDTGI